MRTRPLAAATAVALGAGMLSGLGLLAAGPASAALACNTALGADEGMINAAGVPSPVAGSSFTVYYWEESGAPTAASVSFNGPGGPFVNILASGVPTSTTAGSPNPYNTAVTPIDSCGGSGPHTGQKQPLNSAANWQYQFDITPPAGSAGGDLVIKMTDSDGDHDAVDLGAIGAAAGPVALSSFTTSVSPGGPFTSPVAVTDTATASGAHGEAGTGATVDFFVCPLASNGLCPSGATGRTAEGAGKAPTTTGSSATFQSDPFTPPAPPAGTSQTWCFAADYSGNGNYTAAHDNETGVVDPGECFTVSTAARGAVALDSFTTAASPAGPLSTPAPVTDTATAVGSHGDSGAAPAAVNFFVCPVASNTFCTSSTPGRVAEGSAVGPTTTGTTSTFKSTPFTPPAPGPGSSQTWCFAAEYSGNGSYLSTTDNETGVVDPGECFTISTAAGGGGGGPVITPPPVTGGGGGPSNITINRIGGSDRIDTADLISQASYAAGGAGAVVLARSDLFPDSLAGTPLAVLHSAPILLTPPPYLDPRTKAEIQRVLPSGGTVYLLGQTDALSAAVFNAVKALGYNTIRIGGIDRFATAADIGNSLGSITRIFLADGANFPDALTGAAASGPGGGTAIILTNGAALPAVSSAFLSAHPGVTKYDIGGPAANAAPAGATLLVGADRYGTAVIVAQTFFPKPTGFGVATGTNFPDALTAGPYLVTLNWPMLLTDPASLPTSVSDYVTSIKASVVTATVFGGILAVSDNVFQQLKTLLGVA